jgi:hypothetical protein
VTDGTYEGTACMASVIGTCTVCQLCALTAGRHFAHESEMWKQIRKVLWLFGLRDGPCMVQLEGHADYCLLRAAASTFATSA